MTSKKTVGLAALIALFVTVIGGFVVYAALSSQLEIKGSADFVPESWLVQFKASSLSAVSLAGGAIEDETPTLSDTLIEDFKIILTQPGSSATYTFDIENKGTLDAKLTTYSLGVPSCTGTVPTAVVDEGIVCNPTFLTYTLTYVSGDIPSGKIAGNAVSLNDTLDAGDTVKVQLKLEYSSAASQIPTNTVAITGLDTTLIYTVAP